MALQEELLRIEKNFWTGGPEAYRDHCNKTCLVVFSDTAGVMKREDIAKTAEIGRWEDVSFKPKGIEELSDTSAVVCYDCTARMKDGKPYHAVVSSGYVKTADGWKLTFHQQTPLT
jgi:hypothetical protein